MKTFEDYYISNDSENNFEDDSKHTNKHYTHEIKIKTPTDNLKSFMYSTKNLLEGIAYAMLGFVAFLLFFGGIADKGFSWFIVFMMSYYGVSNIIIWIYGKGFRRFNDDAVKDFAKSKHIFDNEVALGEKYLFISPADLIINYEDCADIKVKSQNSRSARWLVFTIYFAKSKKTKSFNVTYTYRGDMSRSDDYNAFTSALEAGNPKLRQSACEIRQKLTDMMLMHSDIDLRNHSTKSNIAVGGQLVVKPKSRKPSALTKLVGTAFKNGKKMMNGNIIFGNKNLCIPLKEAVISYKTIRLVIIEKRGFEYTFSFVTSDYEQSVDLKVYEYPNIENDIAAFKSLILEHCHELKDNNIKVSLYDKKGSTS